jgi:hydroxyacylglutathione hydrolase
MIDRKSELDYHGLMIQKNNESTATDIFGVATLDDNYVWIITQGKSTVVIDPGESDPVASWLKTQQRQPTAILITHTHHDHIDGVESLLSLYPNCKVYAHASATLPFTHDPLEVNDTINFDDIHIKVMDLSGHTPNQIGYYIPTSKALFCGDALFAGGCGRLFNGGTAAEMTESLARIAKLPTDTAIYCAHEYTLANLRFAQIAEPNNENIMKRLERVMRIRNQSLPSVPSLLRDELATNPFLRTETIELHKTIDVIATAKTSNAIERFIYLRAWKDRLDATGELEVEL